MVGAEQQELHSRVADLVGDGEGGGQADVLVDAAAPLPLAHPTHGGQAWAGDRAVTLGGWGTWGCLGVGTGKAEGFPNSAISWH